MVTPKLDKLPHRTAHAAKRVHRALGVWPWEVLPQYPPQSWAQNLCQAFAALADEVKRSPSVSLADVASELEKVIMGRSSKVLKLTDINTVRALLRDRYPTPSRQSKQVNGHANGHVNGHTNGLTNGRADSSNGDSFSTETTPPPEPRRSTRRRRHVNYLEEANALESFAVDRLTSTFRDTTRKKQKAAQRQRQSKANPANDIYSFEGNSIDEIIADKDLLPGLSRRVSGRARLRDGSQETSDSIVVDVMLAEFHNKMKNPIQYLEHRSKSLKEEAKKNWTDLTGATQARVDAFETAKSAQEQLHAAQLDIQEDEEQLNTIRDEMLRNREKATNIRAARATLIEDEEPCDGLAGYIASYTAKEEEMRMLLDEKEEEMRPKRVALEKALRRRQKATKMWMQRNQELREATRRLKEGKPSEAAGYHLMAMADIMKLGPERFKELREKFPGLVAEVRRMLE